MSAESIKEKIKGVLERWRIPVEVEMEEELWFRFQMRIFSAVILEQDDMQGVIVRFILGEEVNDGFQYVQALRICNDLTGCAMQVKLYLNDDKKVVIASEFYHADNDDMEYHLRYALNGIVAATKHFRSRYQEASSEYN